MIRYSNWIVLFCLFLKSFCQYQNDNSIDLEQIYNQPLFDLDGSQTQINSDSLQNIFNPQLDSNQFNYKNSFQDNSDNPDEEQILFLNLDPQIKDISLQLPK